MPRVGVRLWPAALVLCAAVIVWSCKEQEISAPEDGPVAMAAVPGAGLAGVLLTPACPKDFPRLWVQDVTATCAEVHGATTTLTTQVPPATNVPVAYQCHGWGQSPPNSAFPNEWDQVFSHHPFSIFSENDNFVRVRMVDSVNYEFSAEGLRPTAPGAPVVVHCRIDTNAAAEVAVTVTGPAVVLTGITISTHISRIRPPQTTTVNARYRDNYNGLDLIVPTPPTTWVSSNPAVAAVSSSGVVTAVSRGTTTITARSGSITSTGLPIIVTGCTAVALNPAGPLVKPMGTGLTSVNANPTCDTPIDPVAEPVTWTSTNTGVVTVTGSSTGNQIGRVFAVGTGTATVRACLNVAPSICGSLAVTVTSGAPLAVSIDGPTTVPRLALCRWNARVTGGVGPYTYTWAPANMTSPANDKFFSKTTPASGTLRITVLARDSQGQTANAALQPTLTPPGGACPR